MFRSAARLAGASLARRPLALSFTGSVRLLSFSAVCATPKKQAPASQEATERAATGKKKNGEGKSLWTAPKKKADPSANGGATAAQSKTSIYGSEESSAVFAPKNKAGTAAEGTVSVAQPTASGGVSEGAVDTLTATKTQAKPVASKQAAKKPSVNAAALKKPTAGAAVPLKKQGARGGAATKKPAANAAPTKKAVASQQPPPPPPEIAVDLTDSDALDFDEAQEGGERKKHKHSQNRLRGDIPLSEEAATAQSTEVYSELVRSNVLANNPKDALDILEKMPQQGFGVSAGLCNTVLVCWMEQPNVASGLKQATRVLQLMNTYKIRKNERTAALGIIVALGRQDVDLLREMLNFVARMTESEKSYFELSRLSHFFRQHGGIPKADAASVFIDKMDSELLRDIIAGARQEEALSALTEQQLVVAAPPLPEEEALDPLFREQLNLETRAATDAVQKYRDSLQDVINLGRGAATKPAQDVLLLWYDPLVREISEEQRRIATKQPGVDRSIYGPKFLSMDAERMAVIAIHEALGLMLGSGAGVKFTTLATAIGSAVQAECHFAKTRAEGNSLVNYLKANGELLTVSTVNRVARFANKDKGEDSWSAKLSIKIGAVLIELLCRVARVPPNLSYADLLRFKKDNQTKRVVAGEDWPLAFRHEYRFEGRKKFGLIQCLPEVLETIKTGHTLRETVNARYLPMLVPPRPWVSPVTGGYLAYRHWVMRTKGSERQRQVMMEAQLPGVFKALDILGATPWSINKFVLGVAEQAWKDGGGILDLPSRTDLVIPSPPESYVEDAKERRKFQMHQRKVIQKQRDLHGLRCALTYQLDVANEFQNRVFYFPHNLDFRGRSYPIPPHLNQMGSDLCRGLLMFAEAKPLGETGLRWLKIHLANLYGNDKITHTERLAFIDSQMDAVLLSAADPLGKGTWWKSADSPWQALGVCKAISEALASGDPKSFMCHVPVHQDGSCNGLQHYAALGGDVRGAEQVNLLPRPEPQDVYGGVAKLVAARVAEDASKGVRFGHLLNGKVDRKIVKQTVMTSVYGVTFVGARKQIFNAMRSRIDSVSEDDIYLASGYITRHTFSALEEMFTPARQIMAWLGECARRIAKSGKPVEWVTPLGLPVVQPYRRAGRSAVVTLVQTVILEDQNDKLPVNVARQKSAFAPNFVHSLDSTHMMLTALAVHEKGLTFASVHDSFWTHAGDVDRMSQCLRESFVQLHSEPILQQLADYFKRCHPTIEFPEVPARGALDLNEVLKSKYFFH